MSDLFQVARPEELGLDSRRWEHVLAFAEQQCRSGVLPALSLQVQRAGKTTGVHHFGSQRLEADVPVDEQTLFLIASLTKPMVAMGILLLVERGKLGLSQRVSEFLPDFREPARRLMTVRHLLTHTSGLPDMLPDNLPLRQAQAGLDAFLAG
ncbi:MAG TPA: serine hydrolase domain-containing protein, partial [Planctomicrobium sp.]|nr:serine hydrolase domain-containing protein [Planctomicrobium sp.]